MNIFIIIIRFFSEEVRRRQLLYTYEFSFNGVCNCYLSTSYYMCHVPKLIRPCVIIFLKRHFLKENTENTYKTQVHVSPSFPNMREGIGGFRGGGSGVAPSPFSGTYDCFKKLIMVLMATVSLLSIIQIKFIFV